MQVGIFSKHRVDTYAPDGPLAHLINLPKYCR